MITVRVTINEKSMRLHFETLRKAIDYVSFEYEYYSKIYIETGRYNCADTKDCFDLFDFDDKDHHCELYNEKLRMAFIDSWDIYLEWIIECE